jgi:hypothetical protein
MAKQGDPENQARQDDCSDNWIAGRRQLELRDGDNYGARVPSGPAPAE